jgi:hypothetical protein
MLHALIQASALQLVVADMPFFSFKIMDRNPASISTSGYTQPVADMSYKNGFQFNEIPTAGFIS